MATYEIHADLVDDKVQNVQEWVKTWGQIEEEVQQRDGEILDAYAVLGEYDFEFTYEAPDEEAAMQIAIAVERYGLDTRTHQLVDVERLGELVDDI